MSQHSCWHTSPEVPLSEPTRQLERSSAVVAVARKLAVLLHHLWFTGEVYVPLHNTVDTEPVAEEAMR